MTGGIKTAFFENSSDYSFPDDSPYNAAREIIEPIMATRSTAPFKSKLITGLAFVPPVGNNADHHA